MQSVLDFGAVVMFTMCTEMQEVIVRERELPATYSGPQIVSKEADLTPLPPSAAWGPTTIYAPYTAPPRTAPYVPPTQVCLASLCCFLVLLPIS